VNVSQSTYLKIYRQLQSIPLWVVGGSVRDRYLNRKTNDVDLITPTNAQSVAHRIARKIKGKSFCLDSERHVYRLVLADKSQIDLAQFQGTTLEHDLDRRDFTINALALPLADWIHPQWKNRILDRHKGLADLKKKRLHSISNTGFKEDPLRMLRAFRLASDLHFRISPETLKQVKRNRATLKRVAPERIREEVLKFFSNSSSYVYLKQMEQCGLLDILFPEAKSLRKTGKAYYGAGGVLKHSLDSVNQLEQVINHRSRWFPRHHKKIALYLHTVTSGFTRLAHLKWTTLLHDVGKPKTAKIIKGRLRFFDHEYVGASMVLDMADRYRWSTEEKNRHANFVRHHMRTGNLASHKILSERAMFRFFRDLGDETIGMLLVSLGDHLTYLSPRERTKRHSAHEKMTVQLMNRYFRNKKILHPPRIITGFDIMKNFNLKPSPLVGQLLQIVQDHQFEGKINTKDQALDLLDQQLKRPEFAKK